MKTKSEVKTWVGAGLGAGLLFLIAAPIWPASEPQSNPRTVCSDQQVVETLRSLLVRTWTPYWRHFEVSEGTVENIGPIGVSGNVSFCSGDLNGRTVEYSIQPLDNGKFRVRLPRYDSFDAVGPLNFEAEKKKWQELRKSMGIT